MTDVFNYIVFVFFTILFVWMVLYVSDNYVLIRQRISNLLFSLFLCGIKENYIKVVDDATEELSDKITQSLTEGQRKDKIVRGIVLIAIGLIVIIFSCLVKR